MQEVKKIDKASLAKIMAAFYGLSGVAVMIAIIISSILNNFVFGNFSGSVLKSLLFNIGFSLVFGIIVGLVTAIFGWAIGYVGASIYNVIAANLGGLKIETEEKKEEEVREKLQLF